MDAQNNPMGRSPPQDFSKKTIMINWICSGSMLRHSLRYIRSIHLESIESDSKSKSLGETASLPRPVLREKVLAAFRASFTVGFASGSPKSPQS